MSPTMHFCLQVLLVCLVAFHATDMSIAQELPSVTVDISQGWVHPGTNVTFTCRLNNIELQVGTVVQLFKLVDELDGIKKADLISTLVTLSDFYKKAGRFNVTWNQIDTYTNFIILEIRNATVQDTGHYVCKVNVDDLYQLATLEVYRAPDNISIEYTNYTHDGRVLLQENVQPNISCTAKHMVPQGIMKARVGDVDITDKTSLFTNTKTYCDLPSGTEKNCPLHYAVDVKRVTKHYVPLYTDDEKWLQCEIEAKDSVWNSKSVSALLEVHYAPKINCGSKEYRANVGDKLFRITCEVKSNPALLTGMDERVWMYRLNGVDGKISVGEIAKGLIAKGEEVNNKTVKMTLVIHNVTSEFFTDYTLHVENAMGLTEETVQLKQKEPDEVSTSCHLKGSAILLVVLLLKTLVTIF